MSPFPDLISQIFASNIGGTATLIGDPPNILIGSAAGLGFGDFLVNLAPVVVIIMVAFVGLMWLAFGRRMEDDANRLDILATVDPAAAITDRPLMVRASAGSTVLSRWPGPPAARASCRLKRRASSAAA